MEDAVRDFGVHIDVERNLSYHTKRNYLSDLRQFREFLLKNGVDKPADVDQTVIRAFLASLYRGRIKKATVSRKVASLRAFFKFLLREGKIRYNPAQMVQAPKADKYLPSFLSIDEVFSLLGVKFESDVSGLRDRAIIEFLYSAGVRVGELTGLNVADVDFSNSLVKVRGKGRKERIVKQGRELYRITSFSEQVRFEADSQECKKNYRQVYNPEWYRQKDKSSRAQTHICDPSHGCRRRSESHTGTVGA